jgi:arylsulfatase A-like enzyme
MRCRSGSLHRWARLTPDPPVAVDSKRSTASSVARTISTRPVEPPGTPEEGYHLTEDLADRAISWVHQQKALMPDKPFFVYFAPGATHAPHHVPKDWRSLQGRVRRRLGRAAARQMEVYAGFLEHTDYYIGRLIDAIEDLGILENTAWRASRTGRSRSRQRSSDPVAARKV